MVYTVSVKNCRTNSKAKRAKRFARKVKEKHLVRRNELETVN